MKTLSTSFAIVVFSTGLAHSGAIPQPGDFYLISRNRDGHFVGSHKLFIDEAHGMTKVSYCSRNYFVRTQSVAWTQLESERGNTVRLEYNFGRGWRPICLKPETQVTLKDFGISMSAEEFLESLEEGAPPQSRLSAIGAVFQTNTSEKRNSSFHTR